MFFPLVCFVFISKHFFSDNFDRSTDDRTVRGASRPDYLERYRNNAWYETVLDTFLRNIGKVRKYSQLT